MIWISFYILSLIFGLHLCSFIACAYNKNNVVFNPIINKKQYSYRDANNGRMINHSWTKGRLLLLYGLIVILMIILISILMWFVADSWWYGLIALVLGGGLMIIYNKYIYLQSDTGLYYAELYSTPVFLSLTIYFLVWY
jgi:uncharacterized protein YneF (UPF0154 family)